MELEKVPDLNGSGNNKDEMAIVAKYAELEVAYSDAES